MKTVHRIEVWNGKTRQWERLPNEFPNATAATNWLNARTLRGARVTREKRP